MSFYEPSEHLQLALHGGEGICSKVAYCCQLIVIIASKSSLLLCYCSLPMCVCILCFYADDYYLSVCEQAMRESGKTDQTIMHCMFVGPAGAGKSTLLKRLLRMKLDQTRTSTPVAEKSVRVDFVRKMSTSVASFDWKIIEDPKTQASALIVQLSAESEKAKDKHFTEEAEQASKPQKSSPNEKRDDTISSAEASQMITSPPEVTSNTKKTNLPAEAPNKIQVTNSLAGTIRPDSEALRNTINFLRQALQ